MGDRHLRTPVTVGGVTYPAGATPPVEHADRITNPKAWVVVDQPDAEPVEDPADAPDEDPDPTDEEPDGAKPPGTRPAMGDPESVLPRTQRTGTRRK